MLWEAPLLPGIGSAMKEPISHTGCLDLIRDEMQSDMRTGNRLTNDSSKKSF